MTRSRFDAAHRVVLGLCHLPQRLPDRATIDRVDGPSVMALIERYRCGSLVHAIWRRQAADAHGVLAHVRAACAELARAERPRAARLNEALVRTIDVLAAKGIPAMVLKGQALSRILYQDLAYKPMNDCDVLVRKGQFFDAVKHLQRAGFRLRFPASPLDRRLFTHHYPPFVAPNGAVIDLHWHITGAHGYRIDDDEIWTDVEPLEIEGRPAWRLNDAMFLLHLIIHFHFYRLRLADIFDVVNFSNAVSLPDRVSQSQLHALVRRTKAAEAFHRTMATCALFAGEAIAAERIAGESPRRFWLREIEARRRDPQLLLEQRANYFGFLESTWGEAFGEKGLLRKARSLAHALRCALFPPGRFLRSLENRRRLGWRRPVIYLRHWRRFYEYYRTVI